MLVIPCVIVLSFFHSAFTEHKQNLIRWHGFDRDSYSFLLSEIFSMTDLKFCRERNYFPCL